MKTSYCYFFIPLFLVTLQSQSSAPQPSGLPVEDAVALSERAIHIDRATVNTHKDSSTHHHNITVKNDPETLTECVKKGVRDGVVGTVSQLTAEAIMSTGNKGFSLLKEQFSAEYAATKDDERTMSELQTIISRVKALATLKSFTKDEEKIKKYDELIARYEAQIEATLDKYLERNCKPHASAAA